MEITVERHDESRLVYIGIKGELDLYSAPSFSKAAIDETGSGTAVLVLDLGGVEYLDSSGVGTIIQLLQQARKRGGELRVVGLAGTALKVLKMTNILQILKSFPDKASAMADKINSGFYPSRTRT